MAQKLALVGFHEMNVMDLILNAALEEYRNGDYEGVILTGTSNPKSNRFANPDRNAVYDELQYGSFRLYARNMRDQIIDYVPARTLMGNIRNVLRRHPADVTFFLDASQVHRAEDIFLPYFEKRMDLDNIKIISPEESFRAGSQYEEHSREMDKRYETLLKMPVISRVTEELACGNNWFVNTLVSVKNGYNK